MTRDAEAEAGAEAENGDAEAVWIDARGMRCPWPALRLARAVRAGPLAAHYIVLADDPHAGSEIAALADARRWRFSKQAQRYDVWT